MGWTAYNALQVFAYFFTVFIAAPAALITGLGLSPALSTRLRLVSTPLSIQVARSLHFLIMVWFLVFIWLHVTLVLTTGARANLNHMFAARNDDSWVGFLMFAAAMLVVIIAWAAATPFTLRHPTVV
jgi:thiosulfate reductase cytochrome b subunit